MAEDEPEIAQPMEARVNPRKWTTKVNVAVVIAVVGIFLIGAGYAIYVVLNPSEVHDDLDREGAPAPASP